MPEGVSFPLLKERLLRQLADGPPVAGVAVTVEAGRRTLTRADLRELEEIFVGRHGAALLQVVEGGRGKGSAREAAAWRRSRSQPPALPPAHLETLLVKRTIRSGQRIRFGGNVVILGDINPGAEVVAAGDIVVMGTVRGVAHAGATGNQEAIVAAFRLRPTQLRIGGVIGRAPDGEAVEPDAPEVARVRDGMVVIERYQPSAGEM